MRGQLALALGPNPPNRAGVLRHALASRRFLLVTALSAIAYLAFSEYLDVYTGVPVMAGATYFALFYPLVTVSAVLMGLNAYSFHPGFAKNEPRSSVAVGSTGSATSVASSLVSCSCHTSLLLPALSFIGVSAFSGIGMIEALIEYQLWILAAFILADLYLIFRTLNRLARAMDVASK